MANAGGRIAKGSRRTVDFEPSVLHSLCLDAFERMDNGLADCKTNGGRRLSPLRSSLRGRLPGAAAHPGKGMKTGRYRVASDDTPRFVCASRQRGIMRSLLAWWLF
jgi:hypothetical protein